jgi:hypothetical protein
MGLTGPGCDGEDQQQLIRNPNRNWLIDFRTLLHGTIYLDLKKIVDMEKHKAQVLTSAFYDFKV